MTFSTSPCIVTEMGFTQEEITARWSRWAPEPVAGCALPLHVSLGPPPTRVPLMLLHHSSVNIPFPNEAMADADYLYAFQQIVMPIAYEFAPDLVIGEYTDSHSTRRIELIPSAPSVRRV
jgi:hypothetical protein